MKQFIQCLVCLLLPLIISADFPLTILHTNDVHARFLAFNEQQRPCKNADTETGKCFGGVARRQTAMKKFQSEDINVLKLDAGDQFQGTLWYTALKWKPIAEYMNVMKYDAMAFGNHEFDDGLGQLEPFIRNLTTPIVNSNIDDHGSPIKDLYHRKFVKEIDGQRIGIVGCTTVDTPKVASPGPLLEFGDEVRAVQPVVNQLVESGVNKIIVLSHAGITVDKEICKNVKNVDIVVGGHSHTFLWNGAPPSNEVPVDTYPVVVKNGDHTCLVVQDFAFGKYLGKLKVVFDDNGELKNWTGNPVLLDARQFKEDDEIASILRPYQKQLEHFQKSVVATTAVQLDGVRWTCRLKECNMGSLFADAQLWFYVKKQLETRLEQSNSSADIHGWSSSGISLWNSGGMKDFTTEPGTNVTLEHLHTIMPYQNTIDKIAIKGLTLKKAFEHAVEEWVPSDPSGRFLQVSGVKIIYDMAKPVGQRVKKILVRCGTCSIPKYEPLHYDTVYEVVVSSYLSAGGDQFFMFRDEKLNSDNSNILDTDVVLDYMKTFNKVWIGEEMRIEFQNSTIHSAPCTASARNDTTGK